MASTTTDHGSLREPDAEMAGSPGLARTCVIAALGGAVLAFAGVAGTLAATGHEQSVALGIGGMAAAWGGIGFGAMIGGSMHLMHQDHHR